MRRFFSIRLAESRSPLHPGPFGRLGKQAIHDPPYASFAKQTNALLQRIQAGETLQDGVKMTGCESRAGPVAVEDQGPAPATKINLRESFCNRLVTFSAGRRTNGQQHQIGCGNAKFLAETSVLAGLASKFDLACAVGDDREVCDPTGTGKIDVAVVLSVEDKVIELAQDVRKLPEIIPERGLVEA